MFRYIIGMSQDLKKIKYDIADSAKQLDKHLIKVLLLYSDCLYVNHWKHEIYTFLSEVDRAKGSNKYPKYKLIRTALSTHEDILDNYTKIVQSDYSALHAQNISHDVVHDFVYSYQDWLALELSSKGYVTEPEVISTLNTLLHTYRKDLA